MARTATAEREPVAPKPVFFGGKRRKLMIQSVHFKRNRENEKRVMIDFEMPLTGQPVDGYPDFIAEAFEAVNKENSACTEAVLDKTEVEGMGLQFHAVESSKPVLESLSAATLRKFRVCRVAEGSSFIVVLRFNSTVPRTPELVQFLHHHDGAHVWAKFDTTQMKIQFVEPSKQMTLAENGGEDEDDEEGESIPPQTKERARAVRGL